MKNLKINFEGYQSIDKNYSQSGQDLFVLSVLNGKKNGVFIDIGAHHPTNISNTYLLEKNFSWNGVLIEIDEVLCSLCRKQRTSEVLCQDATTINYENIFSKFNEIDYMSLDIDGNPTLEVLKKLPFDKFKIKVITFEHDSYRVGDSIKNKSREIFDSFGYSRICSNVANENNAFEDWYVHKDFIDLERVKILESESKNWNNILFL